MAYTNLKNRDQNLLSKLKTKPPKSPKTKRLIKGQKRRVGQH